MKIVKDGLIYHSDTGAFIWEGPRKRGIKAGSVAGSTDGRGYTRIKIYNRTVKAHRLAWFFVHGAWPVGVIDHINGNGCDNRIENLRDVCQSVNQLNRRSARSDSLTGSRGVTYDAKKSLFRAHIQVSGKRYYLGRFKSKSAAENARADFENQINRSLSSANGTRPHGSHVPNLKARRPQNE